LKTAEGIMEIQGCLSQRKIAITGAQSVRLGYTDPGRGEVTQSETTTIHERRSSRSQEVVRRTNRERKNSRVKIRVSGGNAVCAETRWNKEMVHRFTTNKCSNDQNKSLLQDTTRERIQGARYFIGETDITT
jgi:hypothetical protein